MFLLYIFFPPSLFNHQLNHSLSTPNKQGRLKEQHVSLYNPTSQALQRSCWHFSQASNRMSLNTWVSKLVQTNPQSGRRQRGVRRQMCTDKHYNGDRLTVWATTGSENQQTASRTKSNTPLRPAQVRVGQTISSSMVRPEKQPWFDCF